MKSNFKTTIIAFTSLVLVFLLGWMTNLAYSSYSAENPQIPFASGKEIISPGNHVKESQIHVYPDKIIIEIDNAVWARYTDTNSMDPLFDQGANGIEIKPSYQEQLSIGDIIAYNPSWTDGIVIHRIIDIGYDVDGWYAVTKGDNNQFTDPGKIRFSQVEYILIGIIY